MLLVNTYWQPQGPVLKSLRVLFKDIKQSNPACGRILDLGLITSNNGVEIIWYFQEL